MWRLSDDELAPVYPHAAGEEEFARVRRQQGDLGGPMWGKVTVDAETGEDHPVRTGLVIFAEEEQPQRYAAPSDDRAGSVPGVYNHRDLLHTANNARVRLPFA